MASRHSFADQPVKISRLPSFRAEHFPYSGPYPWLDREDALEQVQSRLEQNEITGHEAALCRCWSANGYIILNHLIDDRILDEVWGAYEKAIETGLIKLPAESA